MFLNFFKKIWEFKKNLLINLLNRMRPRMTFQWIFSAFLWLAAIIYLATGIYFAVLVYHNNQVTKAVKFAVKIYPFPAVVVNNSIVWTKDYYQQLTYIQQYSEKTKQPIPDIVSLRQQIIEQLIQNNLLEMQAVKNHISVTTKDINDAYQKIIDQSGGTAEVKKVLNDLYGMNEKDFKVLVRQQVLKQKVQDELMVQVKVAHILIKDEARAKDIAARAKKGENFTTLAKQYSEDTKSNSKGGELGWLGRGQFVVDNKSIVEFDNAAFPAKKGNIVGPVKTSIGFEIIKIEDKKGKIDQDFNSWLNDLRKQSKVFRFIK